jgi:hypothetical protein
VRRLAAGGLPFLARLRAGATIGAAAAAATAAAADFDLDSQLELLGELKIVVGFQSGVGAAPPAGASTRSSPALPESALEPPAMKR